MSDSDDSPFSIARIFGAITVAIVSFGLLWLWDTWDLNLAVRIVVSLVLGSLFFFFGGSIGQWIRNIDRWS